jgi:hypothetical protein
MRADLRQKALSYVLRRFPEENGTKLQAAPDRLLYHAEALNGAVAALGGFHAPKSLPDFLDQGIVTSFDPAKPLLTGFEI